MSRTISLKIFKNEQLLGRRSFSRDVIKIGKLRSSDLQLDDDTVARMHAVLEVTDSDIRLVDLGSVTGSIINGQKVSKSAGLSLGDALGFGPYRLELETATQPGFVAPTAAARVQAGPATAAALATSPAHTPAPASPRATLPVDTSDVEEADHHVAQVVASYNGTIVDVQHVGQVKTKSRQAPAWLALGGLMLLAGAAIVGNEVTADWASYQEAQAEAAAMGRAAPATPGLGLGGLGVALALFGLVPLGLGVVKRQDVGLDDYTVGEGHHANMHVSGEGLPDADAFPILRRSGEDYVLSFTPQMQGHVTVDGQKMELQELVAAGRVGSTGSAYALPLPRGATANVEHAGIRYQIASVAKGKAIARKNEADKPFWIYNASSFAVLGAMLALVHLVPEDALSMNVDDLSADNRYVGYMNQPDEEPEEPEVVQTDATEIPDDPGGEGTRHKGEEGKMGKKTSPNKSGIYAMKGPKTAVRSMARDFDPEMFARTQGILGLMEENSGHFIASPFGSVAMGNDDEDVWGGLTGTQVGEAFGVGGLGLAGTGRGGGGNGEGTIGLGNVGMIGAGGGGGKLTGYGRGSGTGFKDRKGKGPQIRRGKAKVRGNIDKDVIRRIVRNHHNEVRHCYNQGLARDPNLRGRVAIMFTIGPAGTVPSAAVSESSLSDRNVGNCVAKAVRRWKFPKPSTGGSAMVTYPFTFAPG